MKTVISLKEGDLHKIIKNTIVEIVKNNVISINEGLITSYDIDTCKNYLKNRFDNIIRIVSLQNNPYERKSKLPVKHNDFVGIVLNANNIGNFREISSQVENLLGWFTGCVILREKLAKGFKEMQFNKFKDEYIYKMENGNEIDLDAFLSTNPILLSFGLIVEAKFSEIYHQQSHEKFYHGTSVEKVEKILRQGLCPKSDGNFPERIYLGKDTAEIMDMVECNFNEMAILEVDVSDIRLYKLYRDNRNSTAVYTYDNIRPERIRLVDTMQ